MRNHLAFCRLSSSSEQRGAIRPVPLILLILLGAALAGWVGGNPLGAGPLQGQAPGALCEIHPLEKGEGQGREPLRGKPSAPISQQEGAGCHWMVASAESTPHSHPSAQGSSSAPPPEWEVLGHYAEACNCEVGCPCIYKSPASHGECEATLAFSITKGHLGAVGLSGLNTVVVAEAAKGGFVSYYLDDRATPQQREALAGIFRGIFGILSKNDLGMKIVPIRMDASSQDSTRRTRGVTIPDVLLLEVEKVIGLDGQGPTVVQNPVHSINELLVAKSKIYRFKDHGKSWEYTGRSGFHGEFFFSSLYFK
ncbi:MAG: DUF1326 domain-containing protein [Nitrospinae bacterium]|nr:DUF1326 domain-containing protein [Nitrospinota bacterium]